MCSFLFIEVRFGFSGCLARLAQLVERQPFKLVVVGSSPTVGSLFYIAGLKLKFLLFRNCKRKRVERVAAIAQLGERQTEDLEVPGSIPGLGSYRVTILVEQ